MGVSSSALKLHEAVLQGNAKRVQKLLKKSTSGINDKLGDKTMLFTAVATNNTDIARILLKYGADPNVLCTLERGEGYMFEWTALHEASRQGDCGLLEMLIEHEGDPNVLAHHRMTPLHIAAWHGHKEAVQTLVDAGCDVNMVDRFHESALVIPICHGDTEVVQTLLLAGCQLNSRAWGNLRKILVERQRRPPRSMEILCGLFSRTGPYSLLSLAIKHSWLNLAILLLQHGYNPNKYEIYAIVKIIRDSMGEIDEDGRRLITCYIAAGHKPRIGDEKLIDNLQLPPNHGFETENLEWIKEQIVFPSLQQLCRNNIRGRLREITDNASILSRLYSLADVLPSRLLDYLALSEFSTDMEEMFKPMNSMVYRTLSTYL